MKRGARGFSRPESAKVIAEYVTDYLTNKFSEVNVKKK